MYFSDGDLQTLKDTLAHAEACTSRFYCIPGREWPRYLYDVITLGEAETARPAEGALASLEKLAAPSSGKGKSNVRGRDFFRVVLDDERILATSLEGSGTAPRLPDLLLYILTHELVHIVRFTNGMQAFDAPPRERMIEERRVHALTFDVLRPLDKRGIEEIHSRYLRVPLEALALIANEG